MLILLFIYFVTAVIRKTGAHNLAVVYSKTLGKVGGGIFYLLFMITVLFTAFESSGAEANVMQEGFSIDTPVWIFIVMSSLSAVYIARKGVSAVTMVSVIAIILISLSGMLLAVLTQGYKEIKYIFPILEFGLTRGFFISILKILGALSCVSIFIPYINNVDNRKKLTKHSVIALLFVCQIIIFSMLGVITSFGVDRAENLVYPKLTQTQMISAFKFMEAGELFVMLQVVGGWFIRLVVCFFALTELIRMWGLKSKYTEYVLGALTILFSYLFSRNMFDMFKMMDYLLYIQLVNFLVIPLIIYSVFYFKHKRNKQGLNVNKGKI